MIWSWFVRQRAEASFAEGTRVLDKGDCDLAMRWFAEAVRIDRRFALGYMGLGLGYFRKGEFVAAIVALSESIRLSDDPRAYFLRSLCYQGTGDCMREEIDYREATRRDPRVEKSLRIPEACPQSPVHIPSREPQKSCSCIQRSNRNRASVLAV